MSILNERAAQAARMRGFTLPEVITVVAILGFLFLVLGMTLQTGQRATKQTDRDMDVTEDIRRVLRRMLEDLRTASRTGEDTNNNSVMDDGEDENGNGRLEADWNVTLDNLTFNRLLPDGTFSLPITYKLNGEDLVREAMVNVGGAKASAVIVRRVTMFKVEEVGLKMRITLEIRKPGAGGSETREQRTVTVVPRN